MVGVPGEDSARECLSKRDASRLLRPCPLLGAQEGAARGLTSLGDSAWASVGDGLPTELPGLAGAEPGHEAASRPLGRQAPEGSAERGLLVCGTGVGASIAANKVRGIRAAVGHDVHSAHQCVEHDDVNVLCIGAQIVGPWLAFDLIDAYLGAEFSTDEDFRRRVAMLHDMDNER